MWKLVKRDDCSQVEEEMQEDDISKKQNETIGEEVKNIFDVLSK